MSGIATGGSVRAGLATASTRMMPVDSFADPNAAWYFSDSVPGCLAITVTVLPARSVVTVEPTGCGSGAAMVSFADGSVGSDPGTSLASGVIVIGRPTTARTTSGSAVAATASVALRGMTFTLRVPGTGSPMPSDTWYWMVCTPASPAAVKTIAPSGVVATVPCGTLARTSASGSPSKSRQSDRTG